MKKQLFFGLLASVLLIPGAFAQTPAATPALPDITKREITDPLLKIQTRTAAFDDKDQFFSVARGAVVDRSKKPPMFNRLWGKNSVLLLEPINQNKPAKIDFSGFTSTRAGKLVIEVHKHPYGDAEMELVKAGKVVKARKLNSTNWEYLSTEFNKEPVELVLKANGWQYEYGFVSYVVQRPESFGSSSFSKP